MSWAEYHVHISDWSESIWIARLHDESCREVAVVADDEEHEKRIRLGDLVIAASRDVHKRRRQ